MLAIIIPYYKLRFFEETLQSLSNQTDKRFKVYIGDDASAENPVRLLEKYEGKFDFVYHRFETNLGSFSLTQQWERCIALSENEKWLMILGDDDVLGENVVEGFYKLLKDQKEEEVNLIRFRLKTIDKEGNVINENRICERQETNENLLQKIFLMNESISASEFIFNRKAYNNKGFVEFPLAWFSDYATWLRFSEITGIHNINEAIVFWRISDINISSKSTNQNQIELKVKSLFLFMTFLQQHFKIEKNKLKKYTHKHLTNLLSNLGFFESLDVLRKQFFQYKFSWTEIIIFEFVIKKIKRKGRKVYESICASSKR